MKKCCICHKPFKGHGNNAEPVRKGLCCDSCNEMIVVPERVYRYILRRYNLDGKSSN